MPTLNADTIVEQLGLPLQQIARQYPALGANMRLLVVAYAAFWYRSWEQFGEREPLDYVKTLAGPRGSVIMTPHGTLCISYEHGRSAGVLTVAIVTRVTISQGSRFRRGRPNFLGQSEHFVVGESQPTDQIAHLHDERDHVTPRGVWTARNHSPEQLAQAMLELLQSRFQPGLPSR